MIVRSIHGLTDGGVPRAVRGTVHAEGAEGRRTRREVPAEGSVDEGSNVDAVTQRIPRSRKASIAALASAISEVVFIFSSCSLYVNTQDL